MTNSTTETEDVVAGLRHDLAMIGLEYASKGLEAQAASVTQALDLIQSLSERVAVQDELARKSLRWFEDNGCAGSLQIELRSSLTLGGNG